MVSAGKQKIPEDCAVNVMSFFNQKGADEMRKRFFNEKHADEKNNNSVENKEFK